MNMKMVKFNVCSIVKGEGKTPSAKVGFLGETLWVEEVHYLQDLVLLLVSFTCVLLTHM
jgi:hypothetical protein